MRRWLWEVAEDLAAALWRVGVALALMAAGGWLVLALWEFVAVRPHP